MKNNAKKAMALALSMMMATSMLTACGGGDSKPADSGNNAAENTTAAAGGETTPAAENNASAGGEKVLKFGCQNYSDGGINPSSQTNCAWNMMRYGIGECLTKFNDAMEVEGWLAESWEPSEDMKTWTFKLKDGIKFSDGCDMTATKVKESLDWVRAEGPNGSSTPEKFLSFDAEVTADDAANTITIVLPEAVFNLPGQLAYPVMEIVDVADVTDWDNGTIGTGPYAVKEFKTQVGYDLVKNENYREEVPYDKVELLYMGDASAKAMALKNGQVDLVENITNVADIQELQENPDFTVDIASGVRCGFAWINFNGILGNDTLRKAILMGVDDPTICTSNLIGGLYTAGYSVLPSTLAYGYENLTDPQAFDAEAAKKLLDDAGIVDTDGNGIRELDGKDIVLDYVYYDNRLLKEFAQAQHQYLTQIGIEVNEKEGSSEDQWSSLTAGTYDLNANNWTTVGTGDPTDYMANWYSKSGANYCGYKSDAYDAAYEALLAETDVAKRAELLQTMQQCLIDDAAVMVDGYYNSSMIYSKNIAKAHISTADYYWLNTGIVPAN